MFSDNSASLRVDRAEVWRGAKTETREEYSSLACSFCLAQFAFLIHPRLMWPGIELSAVANLENVPWNAYRPFLN